ncbi:hypothetical protein [Thermovibrio ammonificans]|jgi:hypothetical protein
MSRIDEFVAQEIGSIKEKEKAARALVERYRGRISELLLGSLILEHFMGFNLSEIPWADYTRRFVEGLNNRPEKVTYLEDFLLNSLWSGFSSCKESARGEGNSALFGKLLFTFPGATAASLFVYRSFSPVWSEVLLLVLLGAVFFSDRLKRPFFALAALLSLLLWSVFTHLWDGFWTHSLYFKGAAVWLPFLLLYLFLSPLYPYAVCFLRASWEFAPFAQEFLKKAAERFGGKGQVS